MPCLRQGCCEWILSALALSILGLMLWLRVLIWSTRVAGCEVLHKSAFPNGTIVYEVEVTPLSILSGSRYTSQESWSGSALVSVKAPHFDTEEDIPEPFNTTIVLRHCSNSSSCTRPLPTGELLSCYYRAGSSSPDVQFGRRWNTRAALRITIYVLFIFLVPMIFFLAVYPLCEMFFAFIGGLYTRRRSAR